MISCRRLPQFSLFIVYSLFFFNTSYPIDCFHSFHVWLMTILLFYFVCSFLAGKDGSKITTVVATPGQGSDRVQEVSYTDTRVIGNGSFGVVFQAKLCDNGELVAIKKVLQDRRFKVGHPLAINDQSITGSQLFFFGFFFKCTLHIPNKRDKVIIWLY